MTTSASCLSLQKHFEDYCNRVTSDDTILIVTRDESPNVVLISEERYHELERAERNLEYLNKLERSYRQMEAGQLIPMSMEALEALGEDAI